MTRKGLMCEATRSKRGINIGRQAGEELWKRFADGEVSAKDADTICRLTAPLAARARVADIQAACCRMLAAGKSWAYIGAMVQLQALGVDADADLDRMAQFVERNIHVLDEAIGALKGARTRQNAPEQAERLADLERIRAGFELVGSQPEMLAQARRWDGETEPDPVGEYQERAARKRERERRESGLDTEGYLKAKDTQISASLQELKSTAEKIEELKVLTQDEYEALHGLPGQVRNTINRPVPDWRDAYSRFASTALEKLIEFLTPWVESHLKEAREMEGALKDFVSSVCAATGCGMMMRKGTKGAERIMQKAINDYEGDVQCVVDMIGGTIIVPDGGNYAEVVGAVKEEVAKKRGMEIVKVKKLHCDSSDTGYHDIKISLRMPNGIVGEIIVISDYINEVKANGIGHKLYEAMRTLEPRLNNERVNDFYAALAAMSNYFYDDTAAFSIFERAYERASYALQHLQGCFPKDSISEYEKLLTKSSEAASNLAKPSPLASKAIPSSSQMQNISKDDVPQNGGDVNKKNKKIAESEQRGGVGTMSLEGDDETQAEIIERLRKDNGLKPFFAAIDKVESVMEPSAYKQVDVEFGGLSQRDIDEVRAFAAKQTHPRYKLPEDFDLGNVKHATREANLWHAYAHHALDSFRKDYPDQISVTYDDLRMIPEIVKERDQVYAEHKGGAWTLVYVKAYGDIEYRYVEKLGSRDDGGQRMARTTTEWLTKKRNAGGGTLTPTSKSSQKAHLFPRTAKILAVEEYVKQNFAEEASKIVETAIQKKNVLRAPNKKLSNLPPVLWVVVRLQSFKAWFGDWEKDPEHASKVLDENGEPLVVYHGTPKGGFTEFKEESYFTPHREYAERYVHAGGKGNIWGVTDGEPSMYELFLNIRKPFDTRTKADAAIFEREFLGKWGNNTPLSERGLPDWTDAADLLEFLAEHGGGYDGVIIDEGGDPDANGNPVWRGVSYLTASPTQIKSATENRGTFDGRDADITHSLAQDDDALDGVGGMEMASAHALAVLEARADEAYAAQLAREFRRKAEAWSLARVRGDEKEGRLGRGAKLFGELMALVDAAELTLGAAANTGRLHFLLAWARVYAGMMEDGSAPMGGELKGEIYDAFVERMREREADARRHGLTDEEVQEMMAEYAGERLDIAMDRVLRHVLGSLDGFLKARARERMDYLREKAYPKRPEGKPWPRGKMSAENYRRVEEIYRYLEMDAERVADLIEGKKQALEKLRDEGVGDDAAKAREEELEDELALLAMYGCWESKSAEEAQAAAASFADFVLNGRRAWQEKLRQERRRLAWQRKEIARHFKGARDELLEKGAQRNAKESASDMNIGKSSMRGYMNMSHLLKSLEGRMGSRWTSAMRQRLADIHEGLQVFLGNLEGWLLEDVRACTGLTKEARATAFLCRGASGTPINPR